MMIEIGISPVAFSIGSFGLRWYGLMISLAILAIILWMMREIKRGANLKADTVIMAALVAIPSGIVFARLLHVIDNIVIAKLHPELVLSRQAIDYTQHLGRIIGGDGLTAWGAILGATLGIWIYSRFSHFRLGYFLDLMAPAVILAQAIGRIGCTLNGCCYGLSTSLPWGIIYTSRDSLGYAASQAMLPRMGLHPTHVYELIYCLIVFGVLLKLRGRFKPGGSLFLIYLGLYSLWRLSLDFIRDGMPFLFNLHQAQVIAIIILAVVIPVLALRARRVTADDSLVNEKEDEG
ncbi:prolipoprotein diacylglyceryl transferase [Chloroflexota bacterium]